MTPSEDEKAVAQWMLVDSHFFGLLFCSVEQEGTVAAPNQNHPSVHLVLRM